MAFPLQTPKLFWFQVQAETAGRNWKSACIYCQIPIITCQRPNTTKIRNEKMCISGNYHHYVKSIIFADKISFEIFNTNTATAS